MGEKSELLKLFKKAADSADMFKDDKQEVERSEILSEKGKHQEIAEKRRLFAEAVEGYREQMLAIVDRREEDYTAFNVRIAQTKLGNSSYQNALTANLAMLQQGFCGKIEVMAMLRLYKEDDLAYSQVEDIMRRTNNPYCNLLEDRITIKKQLNAFESIRRIIRSKVNTYLTEQPVYRPSAASQSGMKENRFSREASYFGSGYVAIVEELEEDLTINSPVATLALKYNSDPKSVYNSGSNIDVMKAEHSVKKQQEKQEAKPTQEEQLTDPSKLPGMKRDS